MELDIRGVKYELGVDQVEHIKRRLGFALRRFAGHIDNAVVRVSDVNGPRGGVDKRCQITVALIPRGVVRVESTGDDVFALIARAAKSIGQTVRRSLDRRRTRVRD